MKALESPIDEKTALANALTKLKDDIIVMIYLNSASPFKAKTRIVSLFFCYFFVTELEIISGK